MAENNEPSGDRNDPQSGLAESVVLTGLEGVRLISAEGAVGEMSPGDLDRYMKANGVTLSSGQLTSLVDRLADLGVLSHGTGIRKIRADLSSDATMRNTRQRFQRQITELIIAEDLVDGPEAPEDESYVPDFDEDFDVPDVDDLEPDDDVEAESVEQTETDRVFKDASGRRMALGMDVPDRAPVLGGADQIYGAVATMRIVRQVVSRRDGEPFNFKQNGPVKFPEFASAHEYAKKLNITPGEAQLILDTFEVAGILRRDQEWATRLRSDGAMVYTPVEGMDDEGDMIARLRRVSRVRVHDARPKDVWLINEAARKAGLEALSPDWSSEDEGAAVSNTVDETKTPESPARSRFAGMLEDEAAGEFEVPDEVPDPADDGAGVVDEEPAGPPAAAKEVPRRPVFASANVNPVGSTGDEGPNRISGDRSGFANPVDLSAQSRPMFDGAGAGSGTGSMLGKNVQMDTGSSAPGVAGVGVDGLLAETQRNHRSLAYQLKRSFRAPNAPRLYGPDMVTDQDYRVRQASEWGRRNSDYFAVMMATNALRPLEQESSAAAVMKATSMAAVMWVTCKGFRDKLSAINRDMNKGWEKKSDELLDPVKRLTVAGRRGQAREEFKRQAGIVAKRIEGKAFFGTIAERAKAKTKAKAFMSNFERRRTASDQDSEHLSMTPETAAAGIRGIQYQAYQAMRLGTVDVDVVMDDYEKTLHRFRQMYKADGLKDAEVFEAHRRDTAELIAEDPANAMMFDETGYGIVMPSVVHTRTDGSQRWDGGWINPRGNKLESAKLGLMTIRQPMDVEGHMNTWASHINIALARADSGGRDGLERMHAVMAANYAIPDAAMLNLGANQHSEKLNSPVPGTSSDYNTALLRQGRSLVKAMIDDGFSPQAIREIQAQAISTAMLGYQEENPDRGAEFIDFMQTEEREGRDFAAAANKLINRACAERVNQKTGRVITQAAADPESSMVLMHSEVVNPRNVSQEAYLSKRNIAFSYADEGEKGARYRGPSEQELNKAGFKIPTTLAEVVQVPAGEPLQAEMSRDEKDMFAASLKTAAEQTRAAAESGNASQRAAGNLDAVKDRLLGDHGTTADKDSERTARVLDENYNPDYEDDGVTHAAGTSSSTRESSAVVSRKRATAQSTDRVRKSGLARGLDWLVDKAAGLPGGMAAQEEVLERSTPEGRERIRRRRQEREQKRTLLLSAEEAEGVRKSLGMDKVEGWEVQNRFDGMEK